MCSRDCVRHYPLLFVISIVPVLVLLLLLFVLFVRVRSSCSVFVFLLCVLRRCMLFLVV